METVFVGIHTPNSLSAEVVDSLAVYQRDEPVQVVVDVDGPSRTRPCPTLVGGRTIKEVGYYCGFRNDSYFIRTFKGYHGVSPGEWRIRKGN